MDLLISPKSNYLLEGGLDVLHEQSNEWLEEINFWRDESAFYYAFMLTETNNWVPITSKNELKSIEGELISLTGGELDDLQKVVEEHERFLSDLMDKHPENESNYRNKHRQLAIRFVQFEKRFKYLKHDVFKLFKAVNESR
jgi:hypothetical protein